MWSHNRIIKLHEFSHHAKSVSHSICVLCTNHPVILQFYRFHFQALDIPEHLRAPLKLLRKACVEQSNVDEKYIDQTRNGYVPDVPELKCYILCLFEHGSVIESDGTIDFEQVLHLMPLENRETVQYVSKTCGTKRKPTD